MRNEEAEKETQQYLKKIEGDDSKGYALQILHKEPDGKKETLIDVSTLVGDIVHTTSMTDNPGKLTFFVQKDPKEIVKSISNGDKVFFKRDGYGLFCGYVFSVGMDATEVFKITAYDSLRYLKNEDNIIIKKSDNLTVSGLFEKICKDYQLKYEIKTNIDFVLPPKIYLGKTLYSILHENIQKAEVDVWKRSNKKTSVKYFIRDNYGTLELISAEQLLTNIELGDSSMLSSYQFETSIDKGTYNSIKVTKKVNVEDDKKKGQKKDKSIITYQQKDDESIKRWGILQKVVQADENINEAQQKEIASNYLKAYCKETKTLSMSGLGIVGLNAGLGFKLNIPSLGQKLNMYILEASHKYTSDFHTMDLTVNANDLELYFK